MTAHTDHRAAIEGLRLAMPYVRLYRGRTFVVKAGGALCGDDAALREVVGQVAVLRDLGIRVVLVHGGGPQTTEMSRRLGLETTMVEGRRVTDAATLDVAVMTLAGSVNTAFLAACRAAGLPAVGLSGIDAGVVKAVRRPPQEKVIDGKPTTVDFGLVGDVDAVDPAVLVRLLDGGTVPVVASLAADDAGQVLNINADTVAARIAQALGAGKLVFLTDTPGLLEDKDDPGSLVSYIDLPGLAALKAKGALDGGMLPKIQAAIGALHGGVERVHLVGWREPSSLLLEIFTNEGAGTLVVRDRRELGPAEAG
jgi:acetylglutamate kinase